MKVGIKQLITIGVSLSLLFLYVASAAAQQGQQSALVRVGIAELRPMVATAVMPGTVVSRDDARISAEVSGRLLMVADIGTQVEKGALIAKIDDARLRLQQSELQAQVAREQSRLTYLGAEEKRLSQLAKKNLTSVTKLEQTTSDRQVAESELVVATVRLEQNRDQLMRSGITAPFPGVVVARLSNPGEYLSIGTEVLRLVNTQNLEVVSRAPLEYMPFSHIGDNLAVISNRQSEVDSLLAPIRTIVAVGSERTHVFEMRLDLPANAFPVGQTLRVRIPVATYSEVVAVPRDALVLRTKGAAVFVIEANNTAREVMVETGISEHEWIAVTGDLEAGDRVVIRGAERLRPDQRVDIDAYEGTDQQDSTDVYMDNFEFEATETNEESSSGDQQ